MFEIDQAWMRPDVGKHILFRCDVQCRSWKRGGGLAGSGGYHYLTLDGTELFEWEAWIS